MYKRQGLFFKNYQKGAAKPLCIAVERSGGQIGTYETKIYGTPEMEQADAYYAVSYTHLDVYKRQVSGPVCHAVARRAGCR